MKRLKEYAETLRHLVGILEAINKRRKNKEELQKFIDELNALIELLESDLSTFDLLQALVAKLIKFITFDW